MRKVLGLCWLKGRTAFFTSKEVIAPGDIRLRLDGGISDASLCPTVAKCVLRTFEISCGFVVTSLLLGHLIEEISCLFVLMAY